MKAFLPVNVAYVNSRRWLDLNSTVSKHLNVLKEAGILQDERRGTSIYYSLRMKCVANFLGCVENFVGERLEEQIKMLSQSKVFSSK